MKILQITASYKPAYIYGGPVMSVAKLSEVLGKAFQPTRKGMPSVEVLTTTANGQLELPIQKGKKLEIDGVTVTHFRRLTKDHSHFSPGLLLALFKKLNQSTKSRNPSPVDEFTPVIVHIHAWWNLVSVLACAIALGKKAPVILSPRGTLSNYSFNNRTSLPKKIFHKLIGKRLLKRCHFHVTSEKEKTDVLRLLTPKNITVIPNFVQFPNGYLGQLPDKIRVAATNEQVSEKPLKLLFLSRIEEKKGLDILLRALTLTHARWTLSIAGDGKPEYICALQLLVSQLSLRCPQLSANINWIGHQDQHKKFDVLADHDLLILPSHDENFANVVIESLAVGTPVLISENVGLADYVEKQNLGLICDRSPESVAAKIDQAYTSLEMIKSISESAPNTIRNDFSEATLLNEYLSLYSSIVPYEQSNTSYKHNNPDL